jgi:hypothetical protein
MNNQTEPNIRLDSIVLEEVLKVQAIADICSANLKRMARIVQVNMLFTPETIIGDELSTTDFAEYVYEIHRAIIVFTHAIVETTVCDVVRLLLKLRLSFAPEEVYLILEQKKQFGLEELKAATGKTIDQFLQEYLSKGEELIESFIGRRSFNSKRDIFEQLRNVGIEIGSLHRYLDELDHMMRRRHQIVHKADRAEESLDGQLSLIEPKVVVEWTTHAMNFLEGLFIEVLWSDRFTGDLRMKAEKLGVIASAEETKRAIRRFLNESALEMPMGRPKSSKKNSGTS